VTRLERLARAAIDGSARPEEVRELGQLALETTMPRLEYVYAGGPMGLCLLIATWSDGTRLAIHERGDARVWSWVVDTPGVRGAMSYVPTRDEAVTAALRALAAYGPREGLEVSP
jgi:hypothetical protein